MKYIKKYKFIIPIFILLIIICIILQNKKIEEIEVYENNEIIEEIANNDLEELENIEEVETKVLYKVDVKGAVKKPGVYEVEENMRVIDAINKAGGLLYYADTSTINLSKFVKDEMSIYVYTYDEVQKAKDGNTVIEYIIEECNCPVIENDACINIEDENNSDKTLININTASLEELMTIPKIGESKAKDIIKYREEHGQFTDIEEIKNISGIKDATYETIKEYITV